MASSGQTAIEQEPQQLRSKPANDREPIEDYKIYARGPETIEAETAATLYSKANPSTVAAPDRDRFYDVDYRTDLRSMVDHVIEIEGPIYFDVLIERIARATASSALEKTCKESSVRRLDVSASLRRATATARSSGRKMLRRA